MNFVNLRLAERSLDGENISFRKLSKIDNFINRFIFQQHFFCNFVRF